jgi:diguanylate cyclase (GGDEF)-like protein/PAS domain S-box-containing protein
MSPQQERCAPLLRIDWRIPLYPVYANNTGRPLIARINIIKVSITVLAASLMAMPSALLASAPAIELSEPEQQWLQAHPSIRLAVDIDWSPFEYVDDYSNYVGMAAEYINLVGQRLGIRFDIEKEKPWSEVVDAVKNRELDMFSCVVATTQRREYADFTRPYLSFPMVIVTSDQVAYVNGIRDLKNETVAVVRGYATQDLLEKDHPELDLYLADNVADALEKLSHGKVYAYIGNIATVSDVIRREGLTNIKISGETPYSYELSMAVRNDWPEFTPILQKALDSITEQERDQIYRKWIKLRYEHGFDYQLLWEILALVSLVIAVILFWNRRLLKEIARRKEAEKLVQDARQRLEQTNKQLVNYVDIVDKYVITSSTDVKGVITSTSDAFCEISGYSQEELLGATHRIVRHEDMPESIYEELWSTISSGKTWEGEIKNKKKNGGYYWVQAYISPNFDEQGNISGYTAIREDITNKKLAEALSVTDELTSLSNRRHFNNLFPQEIARAEREQKTFVLMIIDVDYFKSYNDNYGHQQGDNVLQQIARVLQDTLRRAGDFAFRIGGEEFAVIVTVENNADAVVIAENLRRSVEGLGLAHEHSEVASVVTISIGVKTHHCGGDQPAQTDLIYRLADDALYQAKEKGRNQVVEHGRADTFGKYLRKARSGDQLIHRTIYTRDTNATPTQRAGLCGDDDLRRGACGACVIRLVNRASSPCGV